MKNYWRSVVAGLAILCIATSTARAVDLRVTVENLAPANSISLAPFLLGFPTIADAPIVTIAEGGSGSNWFPAFMAAEPNADLGSVLGPGGPFLPGQSNSTVISVDSMSNRYFTFGTMVVPSNDHFLGNANPLAFEVFDGGGNLILNQIAENANRIWDAGSETENPANAALLAVGTNANRQNENGVVQFNFADLAAFNGLQTAAGYTFDSSLLAADSPVIRISFAVVPEPATMGLCGFGVIGLLAGIRRRTIA
jgi:hypothetical protein